METNAAEAMLPHGASYIGMHICLRENNCSGNHNKKREEKNAEMQRPYLPVVNLWRMQSHKNESSPVKHMQCLALLISPKVYQLPSICFPFYTMGYIAHILVLRTIFFFPSIQLNNHEILLQNYGVVN